jgi:isopentenyl-diphosphate delta-isomerase
MTISTRKAEHLQICLNEDVQCNKKKTGFENYDFIHCALPEVDFDSIDTSCQFLGAKLSFPFMISAMTGGCEEAEKINEILGDICAAEMVAVGVGSQRLLLSNAEEIRSFKIVRDRAPDGIIVGNIGAAQIVDIDSVDLVLELADMIGANAMAIHLNPLQEVLQPEGNHDFTGVLNSLARLGSQIEVPIIVKETGCGICGETIKKLVQCGVDYIDVAGSGGTSFAAIEGFRSTVDLPPELLIGVYPRLNVWLTGLK